MTRYDKINSFTRKFHPAISIISFSAPYIVARSLSFFITTWLFFFYEVVIGVPIIIIALVFSVMIINSLVQPMLGYLSDRNYFLTRKVGRRFLWIVIPGLSVPIFVILLFIPSLAGLVLLGYFY
jgi:Na+/melibiose symporter-like transporter